MTFPYFQNDVGRLELKYASDRTANDILAGNPIYYNLYFPSWINYPPRIKSIRVNQVEVCRGPGYEGTTVPTISTVNLMKMIATTVQRLPVQPNGFHNSPSQIPIEFQTSNQGVDGLVFNTQQFNQFPSTPNRFETLRPQQNTGSSNFPTATQQNYPSFNPPTDYQQTGPPINSQHNVDNVQGHFNQFNSNQNAKPNTFTNSPPQNPYVPNSNPSPNFDDQIKDAKKSSQKECGRSGVSNNLVYQGTAVQKNAYPWMVAMYQIYKTSDNYTCSGVLVSKKHVITGEFKM